MCAQVPFSGHEGPQERVLHLLLPTLAQAKCFKHRIKCASMHKLHNRTSQSQQESKWSVFQRYALDHIQEHLELSLWCWEYVVLNNGCRFCDGGRAGLFADTHQYKWYKNGSQINGYGSAKMVTRNEVPEAC